MEKIRIQEKHPESGTLDIVFFGLPAKILDVNLLLLDLGHGVDDAGEDGPPEDSPVGVLDKAQELAHLLVQQDVLRLAQALHSQLVLNKAVNREDKRSRRYRDRHFAKFERSRR